MPITQFIEGNKRFVEREFGANREYYDQIARVQNPQLLWIGCSDSRVSEDVVTDSRPGSIFVHRNVANLVPYDELNIAAIIEFACVHLKVPDIVICGHYRCGGIQALEDGVDNNYLHDWLLIAHEAKERVDYIARDRMLTRDEKLCLLSEENVRLQIRRLRRLSVIRNLHKEGPTPRIHGWVYSVENGEIKIIVDGRTTGADSLV